MPKITALPLANPPGVGDLLVLDQGQITKRIDFNTFQSAVANAGVVKSLIAQSLSSTANFQTAIFTKQYGVVGDGIVDDTTAFLAARVAAKGRVLFIQGTPRLTSQQIITNREHWIFDGSIGNSLAGNPDSFLVKDAALNADLVLISGGAAAGTIIEFGGIKGQVGNGGNGYTIQANGVSLLYPWVALMGNIAIRVGSDSAGSNANSFYLEHPVLVNNVVGAIAVDDASINANAGLITTPFMQNNGFGLKLDRAQKNTIVNVTAEQNTSQGVWLTANAQLNVIVGGDLGEVNGVDLQIDSGAGGNVLFFNSYTTFSGVAGDNQIFGQLSNATFGIGGLFAGQVGGVFKVQSQAAAIQALSLWNRDGTATTRFLQYLGIGSTFSALGGLVADATGKLGLAEATGTKGIFLDGTGALTFPVSIRPTAPGGYLSSDSSHGITGSFNSTNMAGKTFTFKDGIVTGFS